MKVVGCAKIFPADLVCRRKQEYTTNQTFLLIIHMKFGTSIILKFITKLSLIKLMNFKVVLMSLQQALL